MRKDPVCLMQVDENKAVRSECEGVTDRGKIIINPDCSTSCPGIFAAEDVTNAFGKRIVIASGEGAKAALAVRQYIRRMKKQGPAGQSVS